METTTLVETANTITLFHLSNLKATLCTLINKVILKKNALESKTLGRFLYQKIQSIWVLLNPQTYAMVKMERVIFRLKTSEIVKYGTRKWINYVQN